MLSVLDLVFKIYATHINLRELRVTFIHNDKNSAPFAVLKNSCCRQQQKDTPSWTITLNCDIAIKSSSFQRLTYFEFPPNEYSLAKLLVSSDR